MADGGVILLLGVSDALPDTSLRGFQFLSLPFSLNHDLLWFSLFFGADSHGF